MDEGGYLCCYGCLILRSPQSEDDGRRKQNGIQHSTLGPDPVPCGNGSSERCAFELMHSSLSRDLVDLVRKK